MAGTLTSDDLVTALKAAAEPTRLRILLLLAGGELSVKDLTQILGQSQPRISRHLKLLAEAGLVERFREGSWAYFHVSDRTHGGRLALDILALVDAADPAVARDRERAEALKREREEAAQSYFRAHAADWDRIRALHVAESEVEAAIGEALGPWPVQAARRPRHRNRAHPRAVRRPLRARARLRPQPGHARLRPQQAVEGASDARPGAPRRHLRAEPSRRRGRCGRHAPGAALPVRAGAGHPRGGARAGAGRPAARRRFRARTIWSSCARSTRTTGWASSRRRFRNG